MKEGVFFKEETARFAQKTMAELFGVDRSVITKHLRNVFKERELIEESVCAVFAQTAADGKSQPDALLQPRCHHRGRLPSEQLPSDAVSRIGLVNGYQLVDLLVEHWSDIPEEFKNRLGLKPGLVRS
jgi:hypothetical protein